MKKAQGNIWWVIIGAAIAILVLIISIFLITSRYKGFSNATSSCNQRGGFCCKGVSVNGESSCTTGGTCSITDYIAIPGTDCQKTENKYCCVKVS